MKFFNLDLHIGVIGDIKQIFQALGHEVVDWTISGHAWVLGRERDKVEVIDHTNWRSIDQKMADAFFEVYKDRLAEFDGFIVTHTPCFAKLFERWGKPIITVASTRYEHPFSNDLQRWNWLNEFLMRGVDSGQIIPVANNKYDAAYAELFTKRSWEVIPSLCEYTGINYRGNDPRVLVFSKSTPPVSRGSFIHRDSFRPGLLRRGLNRVPFFPKNHGFSWKEVEKYKAVMHLPYNASVMSIFEHYSGNMPLLFPTLNFAMDLFGSHQHSVFSELSFNQIHHLASASLIPVTGLDPNDYEDILGMCSWMEYSDFYDQDNMPYITYFSSFEELEQIARDIDGARISTKMREFNAHRREALHDKWRSLIRAI